MIAIGADELGGPVEPTVSCRQCGAQHAVEHSGPSKIYHHDGTVSEGPAGTLSWYRCGDQTYLCGIQGRAMK